MPSAPRLPPATLFFATALVGAFIALLISKVFIMVLYDELR